MFYLLLLSLALNLLSMLMMLGMSVKLLRIERDGVTNMTIIYEFHKEWKAYTE